MQLLKQSLLKIIPIGLATGAVIELFMINTGFYEIVTRKEAERRAERFEAQRKVQARMKELNIKFSDDDTDSK